MKWWDWMPWSYFSECWALSQLFHSPFTFIKRLFSSSSLSAVRVVSGLGIYQIAFSVGPGTHETLCVPFKNEVSIFPQPCEASAVKPQWSSKLNALGVSLPGAALPLWGLWWGAQSSHSCGRTSVIQLFSSLWVAHFVGMRFDFIIGLPLLPVSFGSFLMSLAVEIFW